MVSKNDSEREKGLFMRNLAKANNKDEAHLNNSFLISQMQAFMKQNQNESQIGMLIWNIWEIPTHSLFH